MVLHEFFEGIIIYLLLLHGGFSEKIALLLTFFAAIIAIKTFKSVNFKEYQEVKSKTHFLETHKNVG